MNKVFLIAIVVLGVIYFNQDRTIEQHEAYTPPQEYKQEKIETYINNNFTCDGREYCSQMTSCEEATYYINNCPNTKMDGNNDGVPCESQWCN